MEGKGRYIGFSLMGVVLWVCMIWKFIKGGVYVYCTECLGAVNVMGE
jgi:hypothetical protein